MGQRKPTDAEIDVFAKAIVLESKTQADAFRATFPDSKAKPTTAQRTAHDIAKLPKVVARIKELKEKTRDQFEKNFGATVEWKTKMLMKAVELGYSCRVDDRGNEIPNGIGAAVSAIAELNRMSGDHAAVKNEITGKNGAPLPATRVEWTITPVNKSES